MSKKDYIILGGGIIGMMTARELAKRGADVSIYDSGVLGMESSWAAGGILSSMRPWKENPASAELSEYGKKIYFEVVESLKEITRIDPCLLKTGLIVIDKNHVAKLNDWALTKCIRLENIFNVPEEVNIPNYATRLPEINQIRPPRLLKALRKSLEQLSVSIFENTKINSINLINNEFDSINVNGERKKAGAIIIAAGSWTNEIINQLDCRVSIKPIHGQMLCVRTKKNTLKSIILDDSHYLIPRLDGKVLIGSTMEETGFTKKNTDDARYELLNWAYSIYPKLINSQIEKHWSGLRPSTEDGKPYIGKVPSYKNIYINSGHFRKGILQAPASAKLLVDHLEGKQSFMDIYEFQIEREQESLLKLS